MTTSRAVRVVMVLFVGNICLTAAVRAQSLDPGVGIPPLDWSFSSPGARAGAMGGAFIGVADDASATFTNPAGITNLTRPQLYFEFNNTKITANRLASPTSVTTGETTPFTSSVNGLGFVNLAVPLGHGMAVAFTRHEFLNYKEDFSLDQRTVPVFGNLNPVSGSSRFKAASYIGSFAATVHAKVRVGVGVSLNQLDADASTRKVFASDRNTATQTTTLIGTNWAPAFNVGVLLMPSDKVTAGLVYARGAKFSLSEDTRNLLLTPSLSFPNFPQDITIRVPDRVGGGIGVRARPDLLIAGDVVYVKYSVLAPAFAPVGALPQPSLSPAFPDYTVKFAVDDVAEVHVGAEYSISGMRNPLFLRAGVYTNPDHQLRFLGNTASISTFYGGTGLDNAWNTFNLVARETQVKGSVGVGFVVGTKFQTDLAYVFGREFIVSAAVRF